MSENPSEESAWMLEITESELEMLEENGKLVIPFCGALIDRDPYFSIEVVRDDEAVRG